MRTLSLLTLLAAATAALHGAGLTDAHTGASVVASRTYTQGVSSDGTTSVGFTNTDQAYKIVGTTYTALANLSGGTTGFALSASSNGSKIVGYADDGTVYQAVLWNGASAPTLVDGTASFASSRATGISSNGTTIVGYGDSGSRDDAFYHVGGSLTSMAATFTGQASRAAGVSADGNLIVGTVADSFSSMGTASGFIFKRSTSASTLVDATGLFSVAGLNLTTLTAISGNGQVAVGYAFNDTVSTTPSDALAFSYNTAGVGTYTA